MADRHEGERDDPVELVEQLQVQLTVENETLVTLFDQFVGLIYQCPYLVFVTRATCGAGIKYFQLV